MVSQRCARHAAANDNDAHCRRAAAINASMSSAFFTTPVSGFTSARNDVMSSSPERHAAIRFRHVGIRRYRGPGSTVSTMPGPWMRSDPAHKPRHHEHPAPASGLPCIKKATMPRISRQSVDQPSLQKLPAASPARLSRCASTSPAITLNRGTVIGTVAGCLQRFQNDVIPR